MARQHQIFTKKYAEVCLKILAVNNIIDRQQHNLQRNKELNQDKDTTVTSLLKAKQDQIQDRCLKTCLILPLTCNSIIHGYNYHCLQFQALLFMRCFIECLETSIL